MSYIIYNTETQIRGELRNSPYTIDGQPVTLPIGLVELTVIEEEYPQDVPFGFVPQRQDDIDLVAKTLTKKWIIIEETPSEKLGIAKSNKLYLLNSAYNDTIKLGVTPEGIATPLGSEEKDRASFSQLVSLLREYEEMQTTIEDKEGFRNSHINISDLNGNMITLTVSQFRAAIINYGFQINALWTTLSFKKAQVGAATTVEEVNAI